MQSLSIQTVVPVLATQASCEAAGAASLKRIDFVRIIPIGANLDGYGAYTVEMFHAGAGTASAPRMLSTLATGADSQREPRFAAHTERTHTDFLALQAQVQRHLQAAHGMVPCEFCRELNSAVWWGGIQSRPLAMLALTRRDWTQVLERCVNELLQLASTRVPLGRRRPCFAQEALPSLLRAFLFANDGAPSV